MTEGETRGEGRGLKESLESLTIPFPFWRVEPIKMLQSFLNVNVTERTQ